MPLRTGGRKVRYRVRRLKGGRKQRLAFVDGDVVEVKDLSTGKTKMIPKKKSKKRKRY